MRSVWWLCLAVLVSEGLGGCGVMPRVSQAPRPSAPRPPVQIPQPVLIGAGLTKGDVRHTVVQNKGSVKACYERALDSHPVLEGKLVVRFTIAASGDVMGARVAEDTINSEQLSSCIVEAVKRWKFPQPKDGATVTVDYPWFFQLNNG